MPAYSKEKEDEYLALIRRLLVINPHISILKIQSALENSNPPLHLHQDYINKLRKKIYKERTSRYNSYTVNKVLAKYQDEAEEIKYRMWAIANDRDSTKQEKIMAAREIRSANRDIFDKMFESGLFVKDLGKLDTGMGDLIKAIKDNYPKKEVKKEDVPGEHPLE